MSSLEIIDSKDRRWFFIVAITMTTAMIFSLLPPFFIKKCLQQIQQQINANTSIILLAIVLFVRGILASIASYMQDEFADRVQNSIWKNLLASQSTAISQSKIHNILTIDAPKAAQYIGLNCQFSLQCMVLISVAIIFIFSSEISFFFVMLPVLFSTYYFSIKSNVGAALHEKVREFQEPLRNWLSQLLRYTWSIQSPAIRTYLENHIAEKFNHRRQLIKDYRICIARFSSLHSATLPVFLGVLVLIEIGLRSPIDAGNLAMLLSYTITASSAGGAIVSISAERRISKEAWNHFKHALTNSNKSEDNVVDFTKNEVFQFNSKADFEKTIGKSCSLEEEMAVFGLSSEIFQQITVDGSGISHGESKRIYAAVALAYSSGDLHFHGLKRMIDPESYLEITTNLIHYGLKHGRKVTLS